MIRVSVHAQEQMAERNIGPATLNAILADGEVMGRDHLDHVHLELLGYRAVIAASNTSNTVVTVYENRSQTKNQRRIS